MVATPPPNVEASTAFGPQDGGLQAVIDFGGYDDALDFGGEFGDIGAAAEPSTWISTRFVFPCT